MIAKNNVSYLHKTLHKVNSKIFYFVQYFKYFTFLDIQITLCYHKAKSKFIL